MAETRAKRDSLGSSTKRDVGLNELWANLRVFALVDAPMAGWRREAGVTRFVKGL
jgi:hypothetical protein